MHKLSYVFNRLIDKCLEITYDWYWFNKIYRELIRRIYFPIFKYISTNVTGLVVSTRHSVNTDYFKVFGSDIDLTVVGDISLINKWKKFYKFFKILNPRLGEWEFYTHYEFEILSKLKNHKFNDFWKYLCSLRKITWLESSFHPGQEFKKKQARLRILKNTNNLSSEFIRELLGRIIDLEKPLEYNSGEFETNCKYLNLIIGNTNQSQIKFKDINLYNIFLSLIPNNPSNFSERKKLLELKLYILMREIYLVVASARNSKKSNDEYEEMKTWIAELKQALLQSNELNLFSVQIQEFVARIRI